MIYLDNAATTQISPEVLATMMPYLAEEFGNPGTIYGLGKQASTSVANARRQVADFIGAKPEQIIFTSSGTEANNLAIIGTKEYLKRINKRCIITSAVEHESVLRAVKAVCSPMPCCTKSMFASHILPVSKRGSVLNDTLKSAITTWGNNAGLVSIMCVNNEIGTLNNLKSIGRICRENNILFHTDCVQAAGTIPLDVDEIGCDFMSISSHKIHGSKGVGALYVRDKKYLSSIINGGSSQEFGLRGGTENVAGIVGFGKACELAAKNLSENVNTVIHYKRRFCDVLKDRLSDDNLDNDMRINGLLPNCPGKTLSITFNKVDAETLVLLMDSEGVCISAGSACQSHEAKPSHVLTAIGLSDDEARSTVRISFSELNELHEVERAAKILANCVRTLRGGNL